MAILDVQLERLLCKRCGHEFVPRRTPVKSCPQCKAGWDEPRRRGNLRLRWQLEYVLHHLAEQTQEAAAPLACTLERTKGGKGKGLCLLVSDGSTSRVIAQAAIRPEGCRLLGHEHQSCVVLRVRCRLLDVQKQPLLEHVRAGSSFGAENEVQVACAEVGDSGYQVALLALTQAAKAAVKQTHRGS
jgi:hypothetical protein